MDEFDGDAEFGDDILAAMVREIRPDWSLREAVPAAEGTDEVHVLTVETPAGPRECVLKACTFLDPAEFRTEPYVLATLDQRTSIPVPSAIGAVDDHDDLPAPFFLMERCDGEVREHEIRQLPVETMERLAREAGRNLGELHRLGDVRRFGPVRLAADAGQAVGPGVDQNAVRGVAVPEGDDFAADDRRLVVGDAGQQPWRAHVEAMADSTLDNVEPEFADLAADLRAVVDDRLDALDRSFEPVFGDDDYRLGNLLVDPEGGRTEAVLDWGNAHTLESQYNLVLTEQHLSGFARHDDPRRERVRTALREGTKRPTKSSATTTSSAAGSSTSRSPGCFRSRGSRCGTPTTPKTSVRAPRSGTDRRSGTSVPLSSPVTVGPYRHPARRHRLYSLPNHFVTSNGYLGHGPATVRSATGARGSGLTRRV
ncbi:phosphotransferase family protein [Halorussus litoreus]|uniref:phosphotransferase family protein n=1 Tax=Halorussus litoreus TaxID=1710536 RepID=UPI000E26BEB9|nr:phosphotransferase [Halorussus litoreus]